MFAVMDGNFGLAGTMHVLHHYKHCDAFLTWLISNRYTGKNLEQFLVKRFRGSVPMLVEYIVEASRQKYDSGKNTC